jgi:hypothetical protein
MFISKSERMEIDQRLYALEETLKHMQQKINALEVIKSESVLISKKVLHAQAEKVIQKKEKQREYSRRYYERLKAEKAGL